jgi:hypothetical protein
MDDSSDVYDLELRRREERRAVDEAGGGQSEGFELAERDLIEHSSHGDEHTPARIMLDAASEVETGAPLDGEAETGVYGEADEEHKSD